MALEAHTDSRDTQNPSSLAESLIGAYVRNCLDGKNIYSSEALKIQHWRTNILPLRETLGAKWDELVEKLFADTRFAILRTIQK